MNIAALVASAGAVAATVMLGTGGAAAQQNWPQSFFNAGHNGNNPAETVLSTTNVAQLQVKWGQDLPAPVVAYALYGAVIYAQTQMAPDNQRHVVAVDAATGTILWDIGTGDDLGQDVYRTVAVTTNFVYAPCGFAGTQTRRAGGGICAYHRSSGQQAWSFSDVTDEGQGYLISGPVYSAGVVYLAAVRVYNSGQNNVHDVIALNAKTGATRWLAPQLSYHAGIDIGPLAVDADHVYVPESCLYPDEPSCPAERYFGGVVALSTTDGTGVWSANLGSSAAAFSVGGSALYANVNERCGNAGNDEMREAALNLSGQPLWSIVVSGGTGACNRSLAPVSGGRVYAAGADGLHALTGATGIQQWLRAGYGAPATGASSANGVIYTWAYNGGGDKLSALSAKKGHVLWTLETPRALDIAPIIANGVLYVAGASCGSICAYGLP